MKKNIKVRNIVVKCGADVFAPVGLMLGLYIIFHGHLSPGGGFQGGVLVASVVVLIYLGYGREGLNNVFNANALKKNESVGAIMYSSFAFIGIIFGAAFCRNVLYDAGGIGDLFSSGTIFLMNFSVGYKVLTGVGFLILFMIGLLAPENNSSQEENK